MEEKGETLSDDELQYYKCNHFEDSDTYKGKIQTYDCNVGETKINHKENSIDRSAGALRGFIILIIIILAFAGYFLIKKRCPIIQNHNDKEYFAHENLKKRIEDAKREEERKEAELKRLIKAKRDYKMGIY